MEAQSSSSNIVYLGLVEANGFHLHNGHLSLLCLWHQYCSLDQQPMTGTNSVTSSFFSIFRVPDDFLNKSTLDLKYII